MKTYIPFYILFFLVCCISCKKQNPRQVETRKIVSEWMGKTIEFPDYLSATSLGKDTLWKLPTTDYRILLYTDSMGCTSCKLRLLNWKSLMQETDSIFPDQVAFLFYFHPKDKKELSFLLRRDKFDHPVFIDEENDIDRMNHFPKQMEYQCFLLDKDNKVLSIGNPTLNPRIWNLYLKIMKGEMESDNSNQTSVSVANDTLEVKNLQTGRKSTAEFELVNTGMNPLLIANVKSSCGCTVPAWEKQPIPPGKSAKIKVEIKPDYVGFFLKTITVFANAENGPIQLMIKGMVEE